MSKNGRLSTQLKEANEWAMKNLFGKKIFNKDIQDYIEFNKDGISHAIFSKTYPQKIQITYSIINILNDAVLIAIEKDKKNRPDIKHVYKFFSKWKNENKVYFVYIIVRETKKGKFYYDHGIAKEKP